MIRTMKTIPENMYAAAGKGFINATDLADYLVKKGLPFRTAYKIVGQTVACAIEQKKVLEELSLDTLKEFSIKIWFDWYVFFWDNAKNLK